MQILLQQLLHSGKDIREIRGETRAQETTTTTTNFRRSKVHVANMQIRGRELISHAKIDNQSYTIISIEEVGEEDAPPATRFI